MIFRSDINGLRALAVFLVVLFHFDSNILSGGFIGVDVFFVISGFLMTSIIFKALEERRFSYVIFFISRVKRIVPALVVLCLVLLISGYFYLSNLELEQLFKHAVASLAFVSNIFYWSESGYFDASSHEKWLLHTWSLSVEWQFYIIYPLILVLLHKLFKLSTIKKIIAISTLVSFALSLYMSIRSPSAAYYFLPTRAWEMLFGALAFLYPIGFPSRVRNIFFYSGLILIFLSSLYITEDLFWPGYFSLVPVFGAFLVLISNFNSSFLTNNKITYFIGKWSYSIYLWHWPVVVSFLYFGRGNTVLGVLLSISLGIVSYYFIEIGRWKSRLVGCGVLACPFLIAIYLLPNEKLRVESFENEIELFMYHDNRPDCNFRPYSAETRKQLEVNAIAPHCYEKQTTKKSILFHGDSHVQHFNFGFDKHFSEYERLQIAAFSCRLTPRSPLPGCKNSNAFFLEQLSAISPDILILSTRKDMEKVDWNDYLTNIPGILSIPHIFVLGPSPEIDKFKWIRNGEFLVTNWEYMLKVDDFFAGIEPEIKSISNNFTYVSMKNLMCVDGVSSCLSQINMESLYSDSGHFSRKGSEVVSLLLKNEFNKLTYKEEK